MSEGGIYLCEWFAIDGEYTLRLRADPNVRASGPDIEDCMEELCMKIAGWNGDGEAVLELFPPVRGESFPGGSVLFAMVGYNDRARALKYEPLFDGGACSVCKFGIGARTDEPLRLDSRPKGMICGVTGCYPLLQIYRRNFVDLLTEKELSAIEVRPVWLHDDETDYVELIASNAIPTVGYRGASYPTKFQQSFRCGTCGHQKFVVEAESIKARTSFIDVDDLGAERSAMIVVDDGWCPSIAFLLDRWKQILDQVGRRGVVSSELAVLESGYAERPPLPETAEFDWVM